MVVVRCDDAAQRQDETGDTGLLLASFGADPWAVLGVQARIAGQVGFAGVISWVMQENLFSLTVTTSASTFVRPSSRATGVQGLDGFLGCPDQQLLKLTIEE